MKLRGRALLADFLSNVAVFRSLTRLKLEELARRFTLREARAGGTVCREGAPSGAFFIVVDGTVVMSRGGAVVNRLGRADFFGELNLLGDGGGAGAAGSSTCVAETDVVLLQLDRTAFVELFGGVAGSGLRPRKSFAVARAALDRHQQKDAPPGVMRMENTFYHDFLNSRRDINK